EGYFWDGNSYKKIPHANSSNGDNLRFFQVEDGTVWYAHRTGRPAHPELRLRPLINGEAAEIKVPVTLSPEAFGIWKIEIVNTKQGRLFFMWEYTSNVRTAGLNVFDQQSGQVFSLKVPEFMKTLKFDEFFYDPREDRIIGRFHDDKYKAYFY